MKFHRFLLVAALLIGVGALVLGLTIVRVRSSSDLVISFVGYTNWTFGKAAVFSAKNDSRFPLEWWYISVELEGAGRDMPPVYVNPGYRALVASRLKAGESILVAVGEPSGTNRWRVQFQYARSTIKERLLRFGAEYRAPPALLNAVWSPKLSTNSIWLMPQTAS